MNNITSEIKSLLVFQLVTVTVFEEEERRWCRKQERENICIQCVCVMTGWSSWRARVDQWLPARRFTYCSSAHRNRCRSPPCRRSANFAEYTRAVGGHSCVASRNTFCWLQKKQEVRSDWMKTRGSSRKSCVCTTANKTAAALMCVRWRDDVRLWLQEKHTYVASCSL